MPIYEYACTACGERTEARQSFDDPPLTECPICGGHLRRLYSPVGIVFKGSGFYSTDKQKKKSATASSSSSSKDSGSATDSKSSDKSDKAAKPESKKETSAPAKPKTEKSA